MKTTTAQIKVVQTTRAKADGTYPLAIRINYKGRVMLSLPISLPKKYWDADKEMVKKAYTNSAMLNKIINDEKQKIIQRKLDLEAKGREYTAKDLLEDKIILSSSISSIYEALKEERGISYNNIKSYNLCLKFIYEYYKNDNLNIDHITGDNIQGFCKWLSHTKGVSDTTVQSVCKRISSLYRYAIDKGIVSEDSYIFKKWKYWKTYKAKEEPLAMSMDQFENFRAYWSRFYTIADIDGSMVQLHPNNFYIKSREEYATTLFMAAFHCQGLAMCDLAELKASQFTVKSATRTVTREEFVTIDYKGEKRTAYVPVQEEEDYQYWEVSDVQRQKTREKVPIVIEITTETMCIFQPYLSTADTRNGYVFPIYSNDYISDEERQKKLSSTCSLVNQTLKRVAEKVNKAAHDYRKENNLPDDWTDIPPLHFYAARHTFASIMAANGVANANIAQMMGRTIQGIDNYIHSIHSKEQLLKVKSNV